MNMSNQKTERVQLKLDVPREVKDKLEDMSAKTGFPMTLIMTMLVRYYLNSPIDIEHDVRRTLVQVAEQKKKELKLSPRQKRIIQDVADTNFTADLL